MSLLSAEFLALSAAAIVLLNALRGAARTLAFLGLNGVFVESYLTLTGIASTVAFVLLGYGAARLAERKPGTRPVTIALMTAAFVYMRGYGFLDWCLPESLLTRVLATAGLSFLFFKLLHVVVEAGSGTLGRLSFTEYLNYSFNFTTFLLGPIQRYQDFRSDWNRERETLPRRFEPHLDALNRVLRGLVKKFVLAEMLAPHVLGPGMDVSALSMGDVTLRSYLFYFFLYFDFSGYCDVVIGVGHLMGVRPPENFHLPFLSPNVSQYWLRVHRSLTTWLTDYVFNPLYVTGLRSLSGKVPVLFLASVCLFVTMFVSGLWHGTTLNFLVFGLMHGAYLIGFRVYESTMRGRLGARGFRHLRGTLASRTLGVALTFHLTSLAYVPFALDADQLRELGGRVFGS